MLCCGIWYVLLLLLLLLYLMCNSNSKYVRYRSQCKQEEQKKGRERRSKQAGEGWRGNSVRFRRQAGKRERDKYEYEQDISHYYNMPSILPMYVTGCYPSINGLYTMHERVIGGTLERQAWQCVKKQSTSDARSTTGGNKCLQSVFTGYRCCFSSSVYYQ